MSNLKGSLESISLMDVVQLLHVNRKTGKLLVGSGRVTGVLYFSNGEVVHAENGTMRGESAAIDILEWTSGTFDFQSVQLSMPASIRRTVQDLLMDSARISDSRKRLHGIFPKMSAVPWPTLPEDQLAQGIKLFTEERKILPFFDGFRDFQEVMDSAGAGDVAVLQAAAILMEAGRLEVLDPELSLRVATLKTGLFRKGDHLEVSKGVEMKWKSLGPYLGGLISDQIFGGKSLGASLCLMAAIMRRASATEAAKGFSTNTCVR